MNSTSSDEEQNSPCVRIDWILLTGLILCNETIFGMADWTKSRFYLCAVVFRGRKGCDVLSFLLAVSLKCLQVFQEINFGLGSDLCPSPH